MKDHCSTQERRPPCRSLIFSSRLRNETCVWSEEMESWVLEGGNYSFLRSAPRNFNLRHGDGPNHVEIFDITSIPSPRSAISETTCLCDIFGDDSDSPLSSSPASASFLKKDIGQIPAEDFNDSSGSYHTAHSSEQLSDTSDTFEDSKDTVSFKNTKDTAVTSTNVSLNLDDSDLPKTEKQQDSQLSQDNIPVNINDNTDSSVQSKAASTSEITEKPESSPVKITSDLLSENSQEESDTASSVLNKMTTEPSQKENRLPDSQIHTIIYNPLNKSPLAETSDIPAEVNNVVSFPKEKEDEMYLPNISHCNTTVSHIQEAVKSNLSTDSMNILPENRDITPIQSCPPTPSSSIQALTPDVSSSPACGDIISEPEVSPELTATSTGSSPEPMGLHLALEADNKVGLPEESNAVSSPNHDIQDNMQMHLSFVPQHPNIYPERTELAFSSEPRRLSFSDMTGRQASPVQVSEVCSFSGSSVAAHSSEQSVVILSPLGYTICTSPDFETKVYLAEPVAPHSSEPSIVLHSPEGYSISPLPDMDRKFSSAEPHSSEPSIVIHSPLGYTISPSPELERKVYSAEPVAAPSPEPSIVIHSSLGYTISPSPELERKVYSAEPVAHSSEKSIVMHSPLGYFISPSPEFERKVNSPEPITAHSSKPSLVIHSPVGYSISPSPELERKVYSADPAVAHSSESSIVIHSPVAYTISPLPEFERKVNSPEKMAAHSSEPSIVIHSPVGYTISPSPEFEKKVNSPEPVAAHSSEPSIVIHSPVGYTISQSPEFERQIFSSEPETLTPTPEIPETDYSITPTDFRGSVSSPDSKLCFTPESRSITSTPESRQNFLTPESMHTAASPELRSSTCSPEIKTITCSVLSQNSKSPQIEGITYRVDSPQNKVSTQYSDVEEIRSAESSASTTQCPNEIKNLASSPTLDFSTLPGTSRPPSATLSIPRDTEIFKSISEVGDQRSPDRLSDDIPVPEPCISLGQADNHLLNKISEEEDLPSPSPDDGGQFKNTGNDKSIRSRSPALDECKDNASIAVRQIQKNYDSVFKSGNNLSVIQIQESAEKRNESVSNLITDKSSSLHISKTMLSAPGTEGKTFLEGNGSCIGTEMLERESAGSKKPLDRVPVRPRENPNVFHSNNDKENDRQPHRNKGWSRERVVQDEHALGKGVDNVAEGSYREEQVELSFSTRNRKGPASHNPAPSSGDPKSGIPAHCYFESPLTTRQQQSLLKAQSVQKESKSGARRVQSAFQSNHSGAGLLPLGCTSETSSMGSEFDEADNEVKWFTDLAFTSLSSPQGDYLDVYSSSHRSSTNFSQPSTVDSPGAVTWMSYADLRGSSLHEHDNLLGHTSSSLPHGNLDSSKRFEMGSFECVDVAVESREECRRGKRTVPKRQIQLKRRNLDESKNMENARNVTDSPSAPRHSKDTYVRQHSTPAAVQENLFGGELGIANEKIMLQKSASFDETSTKTKMASCIINSVLSKKMETSKETSKSEGSDAPEDQKNQPEDLFFGTSDKIEGKSLSSGLLSECSLSSEEFPGKEEKGPCIQKRSCGPKVPPKPHFKPSFIGVAALQDNNPVRDQLRPRMLDHFEIKIPKKQFDINNEKKAVCRGLGEKYSSDSANAFARNTSAAATRAVSTHSRVENRDLEDFVTPESHKQQDGRRMFLSQTPEITLKSCAIKDQKNPSLKVSQPPDVEMSKNGRYESKFDETPEGQINIKSEVEIEEDDEINKPKPVMHKVRDVRKMVKNTYNLSFKATNSTHPAEDPVAQKTKDVHPPHPHTLHIECKAISRKDKQASENKIINLQDATHRADKSETHMEPKINRDMDITKITPITKTSLPKAMLGSQEETKDVQICDTSVISKKGSPLSGPSEICELQSSNLEMPPSPTSREKKTFVFLQDDKSDALQKVASPVSPDVKMMSGSHSVSMLLKEKGMQADIGVCDVLNEGTSATPKHINILEVPLQTGIPQDASNESQKMEKIKTALPCKQNTFNNSNLMASQGSLLDRRSPKPKELMSQAAPLQLSKEEETTPKATPMRNISISSKADLRSLSSSTKSQAMSMTTSKEIELPIQVRSISTDRPKPSQPPKFYKQPFAEVKSISNDLPKTDITPTSAISKQQTNLKCDVKKNETSTAVSHKEQSTEATSNNIKKLAVSAVSSYKPPTIPMTTVQSSVQKSTIASVVTGKQQVSTTSVQNPINQQQQHMTSTTCATSHLVLPVVSQGRTFKQPATTASSNNQLHKEDFLFHASDDPPSYEERESFSPLLLSDLPPRKLNRYHPSTRQSPCYTASSQPHLGHSYQSSTPPAPQSPGQVLPYPSALPQAQVRPHQCRQDGQPSNYPTVSPKTSVTQAPAMIQPLHYSHPCPEPVTQPYGDEQQSLSSQHIDRCLANRRSPQAAGGAPYREHSRSPNMPLDPRSQFYNPQDLPQAFGHDYGTDGPSSGNMLFPENASGLGYGQGPRRVLLDPETGKYFYIEVPMQPLRKMLFDPELGQYVEVLIPQQAMSHTSLYPPTAAPYSSLHGPGLYAPQYLPYAVPPHSQSAQQPRHPETSVPTSLHQATMGYGNSTSQPPKSEAKSHPSSYLESMYYIPSGMNASPNSTPSDCYHKPPSNMPASGGRRA